MFSLSIMKWRFKSFINNKKKDGNIKEKPSLVKSGSSSSTFSCSGDSRERKMSTMSTITTESQQTNKSHGFVHPEMPPLSASFGLSIDTNASSLKESKCRYVKCSDSSIMKSFLLENARRYLKLSECSRVARHALTEMKINCQGRETSIGAYNSKYSKRKPPIIVTSDMFKYDKNLSVHKSVAEDRRKLAAVNPKALLGWQILLLANDCEYICCAIVTDVVQPKICGIPTGEPVFQLRIAEHCDSWATLKLPRHNGTRRYTLGVQSKVLPTSSLDSCDGESTKLSIFDGNIQFMPLRLILTDL